MSDNTRTQGTPRHEIWEDGSIIVRTKQVKWTPWALPGTWFKLLDYDRNRSYFAFLLKIDSDAPVTAHKHIGAANAYILQGGFGYEHGMVHEGDYFVEAGGITHSPRVDADGCILFGFGFGAVAGLNPDQSIAGVVDVDWLVDAARANGAFEHLDNVRRT